MAHRGKIAFHFPNSTPGTPNFDAVDIKFVPHGGTSTSIQQVVKVYHIPDGFGTQLDLNTLARHKVWELVNESLTAGSTNVAIEFVPSTDIQLSSVSIFTDSNYSTANGARVKIMHESGIYVGAADGDVISAETTLYGLTGREHTASFSLTLYAGNKYYIVYQGPTNSDFYPAYYDGSTNGKYKAYANTTSATQITPYPNINGIYSFMPSNPQRDLTEDLLKTIMDAPSGANIFWLGNDVSPNGNVILKYGYLSSKQMSTPNTQVTATDSDIWGYSANTYFIWHNKQDTNVYDRIYQKTASTTYDGTFTISAGSGNEQYVQLLIALGDDSVSKVLADAPDYLFVNYKSQLFKLKSGYVADDTLSSTPLSTLPASPKDKHFYYISAAAWPDYQHSTSVYLYENNAYNAINQYDSSDILNYLDRTDISTVAVQIPLSTLLQLGQQVSNDENLRNASVVTGSKYYLKINGNEV